MKIIEHDVQTDQIIERDMTEAELVQFQQDQTERERLKQLRVQALEKKKSLLDKLGITEEEAKLLLS